MCFFLTIGIPGEQAGILLEHVPRHLHVAPQANPGVLKALGGGLATFTLTTNGCSCALYHEPGTAREPDAVTADEQQLRSKYKRRGWSDGKIERAVMASMSSRVSHHDFEGLMPEIRELLAGVAQEVDRLVILIHNYVGPVGTEPVEVNGRIVIAIGDFLAGRVGIEPDVVNRLT